MRYVIRLIYKSVKSKVKSVKTQKLKKKKLFFGNEKPHMMAWKNKSLLKIEEDNGTFNSTHLHNIDKQATWITLYSLIRNVKTRSDIFWLTR